jgi:hypothetical protein
MLLNVIRRGSQKEEKDKLQWAKICRETEDYATG